MILEYLVIGTPKPQSRPRFFRNKAGYMGTYSPKSDWFNIVYAETLKQKQFLENSSEKLKGALSVELYFYLPIPKSTSKKQREKMFYVTKKPDIDNLAKAVLDAINYTNLWEDDSNIASLKAVKAYSDNPSCRIRIQEIC